MAKTSKQKGVIMTDLFEEKLPVYLAMPGGDGDDKEDDEDDDDGSTVNPSSNP